VGVPANSAQVNLYNGCCIIIIIPICIITITTTTTVVIKSVIIKSNKTKEEQYNEVTLQARQHIPLWEWEEQVLESRLYGHEYSNIQIWAHEAGQRQSPTYACETQIVHTAQAQ